MEQSKTTSELFNALGIFKEDWHVPQQWSNQDNFIVFHRTNLGGAKEIVYKLTNFNDDIRTFENLDTDIVYKFNSQGFRTDKFDALNHSNINILVAGCSNTFGQEMPNELIWPSILKSNIENDYSSVQLYNLGVSGLDTQRIIRNCYKFIENYGKPEYIFLLLPPIQRVIYLNKKSKHFNTMQDPVYSRQITDMTKVFFKNKSSLPGNMASNILTIKNFESFCSTNNIMLSWFCWERVSQSIYEELNFKGLISESNFADKTQLLMSTIDKDEQESNKYWHFTADNDHPGSKFHLTWSSLFFDKFKEHYDNFRN